MVDSPCKKSWRTGNICWFLESCLWWSYVFTIQHEQSSSQHYRFDQKNIDFETQVRDRRANEHWVLKRLGGDFTGRIKRWRSSLARISKVYLDRHQKRKLKIKFHLYLSDSKHQNIKKIVTWGLKSQKFQVCFTCNGIGPFISVVRPYYCFNGIKSFCVTGLSTNLNQRSQPRAMVSHDLYPSNTLQ